MIVGAFGLATNGTVAAENPHFTGLYASGCHHYKDSAPLPSQSG
jgi:hypothetical protein